MLNIHYAEQSVCWTFGMMNSQYAEHSLCWTVSILNIQYAKQSVYWTVSILNIHYAEQSVCWTFSMINSQYTEQSVCWTFSMLNSQYTEHGLETWNLNTKYKYRSVFVLTPHLIRTGIAQSVKRLATGWTVRGSNPGEGRVFAPVQTGPGVHPAS
jgi:hypothetical protein